jgi:tetratricopeptide (TPR) repeat protein
MAQTGSGENDPRVQELYAAAKAAQSRGDVSEAAAKYEEILRIAPKLGPAYNNLGALYFRERDYVKAAAVLEKGLKVNPGMTSASALLGISLYNSGDYARARPHLEAAAHANPNDANAHLFLAKDLTKLGDVEAGAAELDRLAKQDPKNQEIWYLLARAHMQLSEQALARMNAIDPNSVLAHQLSGEVMESMNNYDGAVVELKKAVDLAPRMPGNHYKLGDAYWSLSQWDSAAEQFQAELQADPANCMAQWKLANIVIQKDGSAADALKLVDSALARCPNLADARVDRARALVKLNRGAEAVADLEKAEKANPDDPGIHFLLAKVYRALGRSQDAQAEMRTYSKLDESARAATAERAQEVIKNKETAH